MFAAVMNLKSFIRSTLNFLHLDLTKNLEYDRLTTKIINEVVKPSSNCIDVGCHKGEIMDVILKNSPSGIHYGFEPIPSFYKALKAKYNSKVIILQFALSDENGEANFNFVKNAPAYSGLKKRQYAIDEPEIEEISVDKKKLDDIIPVDLKIDLIKIDVEGGEYQVLNGARKLLKSHKPVVVFEHGLGASEFYDTTPEMIFDLFEDCGMNITTLKNFQKNTYLNKEAFKALFYNREEYYFIAEGE